MSSAKKTITIGIIGTAGRKEHINKLNNDVFSSVKEYMLEQIAEKKVEHKCDIALVSGGAAWMDHIAVDLYFNDQKSLSLTLCFPCEWDKENKKYIDNGKKAFYSNPGSISNYYHKLFSSSIKRSSLEEIDKAILSGANIIVGKGFHDRNNQIAKLADYVYAFTFSDNDELPKKGGTAYTCNQVIKAGKECYFINLNQLLE